MKKHLKTLLLFSSALILTACNNNNNNSNSNTNSSSSISDSTSTSTSSSTSSNVTVDDTYLVRIETVSGVEIVSDKTEAKKGELVTLTVTVASGINLVSVKVNDEETTKVNETTYTFVMPNRDAIVKAYVSIDGDVVLSGDIAAVLELENGIYVARNVEIKNESHIAYSIKGKDGQVTDLSIVTINRRKTNADIDLARSFDAGFMLAGNAKYDFYYDPSDTEEPCYIQRVELLSAPNSVTQFQSLFAGSVKSEASTYPEGVNKVHYTSTKSNDDYTWEKYTDSSFAVVKKLGTDEEKAFVYKAINGEQYTVVDTYVESTYDDSRSDDTTKFSGLYDIVSTIEQGHTKYQYTTKDAYFDATLYSHDVNSIDRNIHYGYRTGFSTEFSDTLEAANVDYSVTTNTDGTYTSTVSSWKTSKPYTDSTTGQTYGAKEHRTYEIEITFNKAGNLLNGNYVEKVYDDTAFNFETGEFLPNGELQFELVEDMSFEYSYGEAKDGKPSLDTTQYFVSEITSAKVVNDKMEAENTLDLGDFANDYLKLEFAPATALDTWQYGIVSSSNTNVIGPRSTLEPFTWMVKTSGSSTLTVGNHTTNNITKDFVVTIPESHNVRSFYMQNTDGDWDNILAVEATIYANTVREVYCYASQYETNDIPFTPVSSNPSILEVSKNGQRLVLDATNAANITEETTVYVTIESDYYEAGSTPTVFTIIIKPNASVATLTGTWSAYDNEKKQDVTLTFNDDGTGLLETSKEGNFEFTYSYDSNTGLLQIHDESGEFLYYQVSYNGEDNTIDLLVYRYGYSDAYEYDIVGYYLTDEEGYPVEEVYVTFTKNS